MTYTRGDIYIWDDDSGVHFWSKTGQDDWQESAWMGDMNASPEASGVCIPSAIVDEFVMMRFAEIQFSGHWKEVTKRAMDSWQGNGGAIALKALTSRLGFAQFTETAPEELIPYLVAHTSDASQLQKALKMLVAVEPSLNDWDFPIGLKDQIKVFLDEIYGDTRPE